MSAAARFYAKVVQDGDCWRWTGGTCGSARGYGVFSFEGRLHRAHRWAYEHLVADIPDGLEIDHLCRNTWCVNPDHMDPVPGRVNTQRAWATRELSPTCQRGHELTPENTVLWRRDDRPGDRRQCRECLALRNAAQRARYAARKASAA